MAVAAAAAATPVAVATTNAGSGQAATHHLYLQVRSSHHESERLDFNWYTRVHDNRIELKLRFRSLGDTLTPFISQDLTERIKLYW